MECLINGQTVYSIYTCVCVKATTKSHGSLGPMSCTEDTVLGMCEEALLRPRRVHSWFQGPSSMFTRPSYSSCAALSAFGPAIRVTFQSVSCGCDLSLEECHWLLCVPSLTLSHVLPPTPSWEEQKTLLWGVPLPFWTADWCAKCTIHSHLATTVRSGNWSL